MRQEHVTEKEVIVPMKADEIMQQAFRLFLENGISAMSTNELIRRLGMTKGGFYYAFKSREDLIQQIFEAYIKPYFTLPAERMEKCWQEMKRTASTQTLLWEGYFQPQLFCVYTHEIGMEIAFRDFYLLAYEGLKKLEGVEGYFAALTAARKNSLKRILKRGKLLGELRRDIDIEDCISMVIALQDGILALRMLDEHLAEEEKYKRVIERIWKDISITAQCSQYTDGGVSNAAGL